MCKYRLGSINVKTWVQLRQHWHKTQLINFHIFQHKKKTFYKSSIWFLSHFSVLLSFTKKITSHFQKYKIISEVAGILTSLLRETPVDLTYFFLHHSSIILRQFSILPNLHVDQLLYFYKNYLLSKKVTFALYCIFKDFTAFKFNLWCLTYNNIIIKPTDY